MLSANHEIAITESEADWIARVSTVEGGWRSVTLIDLTPHTQRKKRFYNLAWSGATFAVGGELRSLLAHHLPIAEALAAKLRKESSK
jgi:hypothetical protein